MPPTDIPPRARARRARCLEGAGAGSRWPRSAARSSRPSLPRRRLLDRGADPRVGPAATDVAAHGLVDLGVGRLRRALEERGRGHDLAGLAIAALRHAHADPPRLQRLRSEEHTSELQSQSNLVCRLLLEKKK